MGIIRNPMFRKRWYQHKTPELQISILKLILTSGSSSKKKTAKALHTNYSDVSDSMKALEERKFIRFSGSVINPGHNREKFYRITEEGLRALLEVKLDREDFWRAIILLCINSKLPLSRQEFECYFNNFEREFLSHPNIHGYFFMKDLFEDILDSWLKLYGSTDTIPVPQKLIEYLAFNGPTSLKQLIKETSSSKDEIDKLLVENDISFQNISYDATNPNIQSRKKAGSNKIYSKLILHLLLRTRETKAGLVYELSLFGVMLAIAIITYHFAETGYTQGRRVTGEARIPSKRLKLFYDNTSLKLYFDTIANNYRHKIPLIFDKWTMLQSQLGTLLYDSFDFLLYKANRAHTVDQTIWSLGTKEYYDEIRALAYNTIKRLYIIFFSGKAIIKEFENRQRWITNDPRMTPIYDELTEAEVIMKYANIWLDRGGNLFSKMQNNKQQFIKSIDIKVIEDMFRNEISFLFYLSLNTIFLPRPYKYPSRSSIQNDKLIVSHEVVEEELEGLRLGSPRRRLMAILSKDTTIRQWFSHWIAGIIEYRQETSKRMSEFYDEIINANERIKEIKTNSSRHKNYSWPEEYDIKKIYIDDFESIL